MDRRNVAGWKVPAPTSMSRGWRTTQPCCAQKFCNARIRPWKVLISGAELLVALSVTTFACWSVCVWRPALRSTPNFENAHYTLAGAAFLSASQGVVLSEVNQKKVRPTDRKSVV